MRPSVMVAGCLAGALTVLGTNSMLAGISVLVVMAAFLHYIEDI